MIKSKYRLFYFEYIFINGFIIHNIIYYIVVINLTIKWSKSEKLKQYNLNIVRLYWFVVKACTRISIFFKEQMVSHKIESILVNSIKMFLNT